MNETPEDWQRRPLLDACEECGTTDRELRNVASYGEAPYLMCYPCARENFEPAELARMRTGQTTEH